VADAVASLNTAPLALCDLRLGTGQSAQLDAQLAIHSGIQYIVAANASKLSYDVIEDIPMQNLMF